MTNRYEELISSFESKLQRLISEYESLKIQNASLQAELSQKHNELMHANKEILEIRENYNHLRTARYLSSSPKERKISKQYVDKMVREIDKCLALLDE